MQFLIAFLAQPLPNKGKKLSETSACRFRSSTVFPNTMRDCEQKQSNAILNSLTQMLPDGQPQSAPEIALLQSRMEIKGKNSQKPQLVGSGHRQFSLIPCAIVEVRFPGQIVAARITGQKANNITVEQLYIPPVAEETPTITVVVEKDNKFLVRGGLLLQVLSDI
jgi:hypothetical protein